MNRNFEHSGAARWGWRIGRAWRRLFHLQAICRHAMVQAGLSVGAATLLIATGWLAVAATIIHYALWVAVVVLLVAFFVASGASDIPNSVEREYEWRRGFLGFGLYDADGFRVDPRDPEKRD